MRTQKEVKDYLKSKGFESEDELREAISLMPSYDGWERLDGETTISKASILWAEWEEEKEEKLYCWDAIECELIEINSEESAKKVMIDCYVEDDECHPELEEIMVLKLVSKPFQGKTQPLPEPPK